MFVYQNILKKFIMIGYKMIRISIQTSNYEEIKDIFCTLLRDNDLKIDKLNIDKMYDIYIIEIKDINELKTIKYLKRNKESLVYIIGPKDFDIVNECIRLNTHLYIIKEDLYNELLKYKEDIFKHVQERFQYYNYRRNGINSRIRLSQIFYVESLRHNIIIHSINGEFIERKNLSDFLKEVSQENFIQIHKSFVVNKQQIKKITNKDVIVNNDISLPIGRSYKKILKT